MQPGAVKDSSAGKAPYPPELLRESAPDILIADLPTGESGARGESKTVVLPPITPTLAILGNLTTTESMNIFDEVILQYLTPKVEDSNSMRLTDLYPDLAAIFPHASGSHGQCVFRNLVECLHVQQRLYEEWISIMDDYSAVFTLEQNSRHHNSAEELIYRGSPSALHFRVKSSRPEVCNLLVEVFARDLSSWVELPTGFGLAGWNLLWTWSRPRLHATQLVIWQRYNHFHGSKQLTRKDLLKRNLQRYTDMHGRAAECFEIMPQTFLLPLENKQFIGAFIENAENDASSTNVWILKPIGLSRGRGIKLVRDLDDITLTQASVLQKYIERPLCLMGYKFDLRLYVLVTSFSPLEAFLYKEGFARMSTEKYSLDPKEKNNKFVHLTNSSIQSKSLLGATYDNPVNSKDGGGTKLSLHGDDGLWAKLKRLGVDTLSLWRSICILVLKSLVAVNDQIQHQSCAFEVFGYDVIIDADLRPWLLEVNASPSMARDTALDVRVKDAMIRDTVLLLDPAPYDREALLRVLQRRLSELRTSTYALPRRDNALEGDLASVVRFGTYPRFVLK